MTIHQLKRDLGLIDAVGVGLGAVIGAGIFVVTGVAAGQAGPAFLLGLLVAGFAATCNGLSSAQLAAVYPQAGGTYEYGYRVLNPWMGFAAGWMFLASKLAAGGVVALGFGTYLAALVPGVNPRIAGVVLVLVLMGANLMGIKKVGRLNLAIVGTTVCTLVYFVFTGIPSFNIENLQPFAPERWQGVAEASALLFFAFTGYARITTLGEEVHEPKKTIPRAVILTLVTSVVLYAGVALVAVGAIGAKALGSTGSPLGLAAASFKVPGVAWVIGLGGITAMLGVSLSQLLGISRMMYAMARKQDLPPFLQAVHPKYAVPHWGILLTGGIIILLTVFGTLQFVVAAASFTILLYYSIANISAMKMQKSDRLFPQWVPMAGLMACLSLAASLRWETIASGLVLLAVGFVWRVVYRGLTKD